jgi:hypothetical protein
MVHKTIVSVGSRLSQKVVLELLRELGGRATSRQISQLALQRYPGDTLYTYVGNRLRKLENWDLVKHNPDDTWEIVVQQAPKSSSPRRAQAKKPRVGKRNHG